MQNNLNKLHRRRKSDVIKRRLVKLIDASLVIGLVLLIGRLYWISNG